MNKDITENHEACRSTCGKTEVPSDDEMRALNAMRGIKEQVRTLKKQLSEISSTKENSKGALGKGLEEEMMQLRERWREWEEKRKKAAVERMVRLGHEEK